MPNSIDLRQLSPARRAGLQRLGACIEFGPGEVIFYAGHQPYGAYLVDAGRVKLTGRRTHGEAASGDLLGYEACQAHRPHRMTAVCEERVRVWFISLRDLPKLPAPARAALAS